MKTFSYGKAGIRYVILMVLGIALMVVAKPQGAQAVTCQQACLTALQQCDLACGNPPRITQPCTSACGTRYSACLATCN